MTKENPHTVTRSISVESLKYPGKFVLFTFTVTPEFCEDLLAVHGIDFVNHEVMLAKYLGVHLGK